MLVERHTVHMRGHQGVAVHRLLNWNTADEWRNFPGDFVQTAEHDVFARGFDAGVLQQVAKARTAKPGRTDGSPLPLNARNRGMMESTSITGTFQSIDNRVRFDLAEIGKAQREWFFHLPGHAEAPLSGIECSWLVHVVAHEEVWDWR